MRGRGASPSPAHLCPLGAPQLEEAAARDLQLRAPAEAHRGERVLEQPGVADGLQESVSWIGRRALRLVLAKMAWQEDCHEEQPGCHGSAFLETHSKRTVSNSCSIVSPAQLKPF